MSSASAQSPLTTLAKLILAQAESIDAAYSKHSGAGFPPLSEPQYPYAPHPLEKDPQVKYATMLLTAAAQQLVASVTPATGSIVFDAMDSFYAVCIGIVESHNVADILRELPEGLHVDDIAARAGIKDAQKLARILRFLASRHIFRESKPDCFVNNRISSSMVKGLSLEEIKAKPEFQYEKSPYAAGAAMSYDEAFQSLSRFVEWFDGPVGDDSKSPFELATGMTAWEYHDKNEVARRRFAVVMEQFGNHNPALSISVLKSLSLAAGSVVVDVGGNVGSLTLVLSGERPDLKYVVQDTPRIVELAERYWNKESPELFAAGTVKLQTHDFFAPQPVKCASLYILRHILHDWPRFKSIQIMKHLRDAAAKGTSRLVVIEALVPYACRAPAGTPFAEATVIPGTPDILLPNLGAGLGGLITKMDLMMGSFCEGQERTVSDFIDLGDASGWKLENVIPGGQVSAVVFVAA